MKKEGTYCFFISKFKDFINSKDDGNNCIIFDKVIDKDYTLEELLNKH